MYLDSQLLFSDAQALSATAASTNLVDLGVDANQGIGEPLAVVITVDVAADGTTTDETYAFALQTDDNSSFSSAATILSRTIGYASLTAGSQHVIPVPADTSLERYVRLNYTLGGTTPTVTVTAALVPQKFLQNYQAVADGVTITS